MSFEQALSFILAREGGYVEHPKDPGGATNRGVTRRTLSKWRGHEVSREDVRGLTYIEAAKIYRYEYWQRCKCDRLPPAIAFLMFDAAVNQGVTRAIKILQKSINVTVDGIIGGETLRAVGLRNPKRLMIEFAARRMRHYGLLAIFSIFGLGWSRRLMEVLYEAIKIHTRTTDKEIER